MSSIQISAIIVCLSLMLVVVELIRRGRLEEKYAIIWLLTSLLLIIFSINFEIIKFFASLTGVLVPSNFLFLLAFLFLVIISLSITVVVSSQSQKNKRLTQELSVMRFTVEEMKSKLQEVEDKVAPKANS